MQQVVNVYWEAATLNINLNIHDILNEILGSHIQVDDVVKCDSRCHSKVYPTSKVMKVETKDDSNVTLGK